MVKFSFVHRIKHKASGAKHAIRTKAGSLKHKLRGFASRIRKRD